MSLILLYLILAGVQAAPQYAPLVQRGTNTTLAPSSFTGQAEAWQKNVYILQMTRITLLIFFAIMVHFVYARWRIHKRLASPRMTTQCKPSHDFPHVRCAFNAHQQ